jgi:AAA+ ATPase superfamily predicted ATPase
VSLGSAINPFKFASDIAKGEYFADRKKEIRDLKHQLKQSTRILIFAARRYGKTALIMNTLDELAKEGILTAYFDVSTAPDKSLFIAKYKFLFIQPRSKEWFFDWAKRNIPKIKVTVADFEIDLSGLSDSDLNLAFDKIVDLPQQLAVKMGQRVVVALDEFHEIRSLDSKRTENLLRSKFQSHTRVSYVFSGSKLHVLQDMFATKGSPFYKSAMMFELKRIPKEEYAEFITSRFKKGGIVIHNDQVDDILSKTDSHTYYTQQLCHELWDVCRVREHLVVQDGDIAAAIIQVVLNQSAVYEKTWEDLSLGHRKLIRGILKVGGHQVWSKAFKQETRLSDGAIEKGLKSTIEDYLIEKDSNGVYQIPDLFFCEWLQKKLQ